MGRKKVDRTDKTMITFEGTKPLKARLETRAKNKDMTVSALIRDILEHYFEFREN